MDPAAVTMIFPKYKFVHVILFLKILLFFPVCYKIQLKVIMAIA